MGWVDYVKSLLAAMPAVDGPIDDEHFRRRLADACIALLVPIVGFSLFDPLLAPRGFLKVYALKILMAGCLLGTRHLASQPLSRSQLRTLLRTSLLATSLFLTIPPTLAGVNWYSFVTGAILTLCLVAFIPIGPREQLRLGGLIFATAWLPALWLRDATLLLLPACMGMFCWGVSVFFALQLDAHRRETATTIESFRGNLERLRLVTEQVPGVLWLSDPSGKLIYVSRRFEEILGGSPAPVVDASDSWVRSVHPDDRERLTRWLADDAKAQGGVCEYRIVRADGKVRWIREMSFTIAGTDGEPWRMGRLSLDMTAWREAEQARRMRDLARAVQGAVDEERKRIARELHDELGQVLTGIRLFLSMARDGSVSRENAAKYIDVSLQEVEKAMAAVRSMIYSIRPPALDDLGLLVALRRQAESFSERTGIPCEVALPDSLPPLQEDELTTIFRVAQEALTNVARHADASAAQLALTVAGRRLALRIEDNGRGFEDTRENFGLRGMRERAALVDGSLRVEARENGGTVVDLAVPLGRSDSDQSIASVA